MGRASWLLAIVWLALVGVGAHALFAYSTSPGARGASPETWPAGSLLARDAANFTVVMFVHPECTCSRASLTELAAIVADAKPAPHVIVAFASSEPAGDNWDRARGFERVLDPGGAEAHRFGAETSGHVVVYDAAGSLRYSGGITGSRGHAGDNVGRRTVLATLAGGATRDFTHAVFGCALVRR
jgi:hypothetical protein